MYIRKIVLNPLKTVLKQQYSRNAMAKIADKNLTVPAVPKDGRQLSLLTKNKLIDNDLSQNIVHNAIRKSSGGVEDYVIGHTIPGLRYMMGSLYRTTLVFTLFLVPTFWAPTAIFVFIWSKQMGSPFS